MQWDDRSPHSCARLHIGLLGPTWKPKLTTRVFTSLNAALLLLLPRNATPHEKDMTPAIGDHLPARIATSLTAPFVTEAQAIHSYRPCYAQ